MAKFSSILCALLISFCIAAIPSHAYGQSFPRMGGTPPDNVYGLSGAKNVYSDEHYFGRPNTRQITGVYRIPNELLSHPGYSYLSATRLFGVDRVNSDSLYGVRSHPFNAGNSQSYFR